MEFFVPKYRRDPNAMVHSVYSGVTSGGTVSTLVKKHPTEDRLETTRSMGPMLPRGVGGRVGVLILGGMVTTLDEMEYLIEGAKQKKWTPKKTSGEISLMCQALAERRNDAIKHYRKNPSEAPNPKRKVRFYLPAGVRMVPTNEPGLSIAMRG